jgi:hypothetical protein
LCRYGLRALNIRDFYSPKNVKTVIDAADGYQPHLVAPEMGIRRLIELGRGLTLVHLAARPEPFRTQNTP